jgi:hypothetical protein
VIAAVGAVMSTVIIDSGIFLTAVMATVDSDSGGGGGDGSEEAHGGDAG